MVFIFDEFWNNDLHEDDWKPKEYDDTRDEMDDDN